MKVESMTNTYRVGVLGATGAVGQKFIELLEDHPWFNVTELIANHERLLEVDVKVIGCLLNHAGIGLAPRMVSSVFRCGGIGMEGAEVEAVDLAT